MLRLTILNNFRLLHILCLAGCLGFLTLPALAQQDSDQSVPEGLIAGPKVTATTAPPPTAKPTPIVDNRPVNPKDRDSQEEKGKKRRARNEFVGCDTQCDEILVNCKAASASVGVYNPTKEMAQCQLNLNPEQGLMLSFFFGIDVCGKKDKNDKKDDNETDEWPPQKKRPIKLTAAQYVDLLNPDNARRVAEEWLLFAEDVLKQHKDAPPEEVLPELLFPIFTIPALFDEAYHIQDAKNCTRSLQCQEFRSAKSNLNGLKSLKPFVRKLVRKYPNYSEAIMKNYCSRETLLRYIVQIEKCACNTKPFGYGPCQDCASEAEPTVSRFCEGTTIPWGAIRENRDYYLKGPPNRGHTCATYATMHLCEEKICGERQIKGFNRCMRTPQTRRDIFDCYRTADRRPPFVDMRR